MSGSGIKNKSGLQRFIYPTRKSAVLDADSTLSDRYQTTVPKLILQALALRQWEKIHYQFQATGEVAISRSDVVLEEGPMLVIFLAFVARDMATRPKRIQMIDGALMKRARALVAGMQVGLDAPLSTDGVRPRTGRVSLGS